MPRAFTFDFDGLNSRVMGLYATSYDYLLPPKREKRKEIPFRHGSHDYGTTFYKDRILTVRCFWLNDKIKNLSRSDIREIVCHLSKKGRITLDCEPDKHYVGELSDPPTLAAHYDRAREDIRTTDGGFDLEFICDPFAIGQNVRLDGQTGRIADIDYKGTAETPTIITLRNASSHPVSNIRIAVTRYRR